MMVNQINTHQTYLIAQQYNYLIGLTTHLDGQSDKDIKKVDRFSEYGTLVRITGEEASMMSLLSSSGQSQYYKIFQALAFARFRITNIIKATPFILANIELCQDEITITLEKELYKKEIIQNFKKNAKNYFQTIQYSEDPKFNQIIDNEKSINKLIYTIAQQLEITTNEKLKILQINSHEDKLSHLNKILVMKVEELKVTKEMEDKVRKEMQQETKKIILKKQLDGIKKELYGNGKNPSDLTELEQRIKNAKLPEKVRETVDLEFSKLQQTNSHNQESYVIRNYIELILQLPWQDEVEETISLEKAQQILDRDHQGLTKVKQRILQFLAVKQLTNKSKESKGSIICFHGPPGVGKTSLGQSIAASLNRPFYRLSLGGITDEAQIRGHRRTYVAAMPGQIINAMKNVKCKNPVILLDEIDKIGRDFKGNPSSALLEVLDPEQNSKFMDHYLNLEFDLSQVLFIATANDLSPIQPPLLDRLELINIPGYTKEEKVNIAKTHLVPKQLKKNGLTEDIVEIPIPTIRQLITEYSNEPGVRQLERNIASIFRYSALQHVQKKSNDKKMIITDLFEILGSPIYKDQINEILVPGVAKGLAWTSGGGKILLVETVKMPGKGQIEITGQLGDVMKESVKAALGYIKSKWSQVEKYIRDENQQENTLKIFDCQVWKDIHIHFPAGAIPKDGPSAGITITTALVSLLTNRKVRNDIAMTGEITLTGKILPVGGIKEKVLAAHEGGLNMVMIPYDNKKDIDELESEVKNQIQFLFVSDIGEVIHNALEGTENIIFDKKINKFSKL